MQCVERAEFPFPIASGTRRNFHIPYQNSFWSGLRKTHLLSNKNACNEKTTTATLATTNENANSRPLAKLHSKKAKPQTSAITAASKKEIRAKVEENKKKKAKN